MEDLVIYTPSRYSRTKAPILRNSLNEYELNILKVAEQMYLQKSKVYIAINDGLRPGELITIGNLTTKYRIKKEEWFSQKGNRLYSIEKCDGTPFEAEDFQNATKGAKVIVINRKTDAYYVKMVLRV
jgi:hypothetical protein